MKKSTQVTERTVYSIKCSKCKRAIKGFSEKQVNYNLKLHLDSHESEEKFNVKA